MTQAKLTKKLLKVGDLNDIGFEITQKDNFFISNTRGYLLDDQEIINLEEKSLLEKDEQIIFTKDPTTIQDLEEEMDE